MGKKDTEQTEMCHVKELGKISVYGQTVFPCKQYNSFAVVQSIDFIFSFIVLTSVNI
jgi:hypothetical protein